jgi:hypothetical protein
MRLTRSDLIEFAKNAPESGMGYTIVTVYLKDGTFYEKATLCEGRLTIRTYFELPFSEKDIEKRKATQDKSRW